MSIFDKDDDFSIDRFNLELEAERNAALMRKYGKLLSIASANAKDEKRILSFTETECAEIIRSNPGTYGLKNKPTDKVCFGLAQNEPAYKIQFKKWLNVFRKEEDYKSAVDTLRQRSMLIGILAKLWHNNYYAKPVIYDKPKPSKLRYNLNEKSDNFEY